LRSGCCRRLRRRGCLRCSPGSATRPRRAVEATSSTHVWRLEICDLKACCRPQACGSG
jgi:hypothetical protein